MQSRAEHVGWRCADACSDRRGSVVVGRSSFDKMCDWLAKRYSIDCLVATSLENGPFRLEILWCRQTSVLRRRFRANSGHAAVGIRNMECEPCVACHWERASSRRDLMCQYSKWLGIVCSRERVVVGILEQMQSLLPASDASEIFFENLACRVECCNCRRC